MLPAAASQPARQARDARHRSCRRRGVRQARLHAAPLHRGLVHGCQGGGRAFLSLPQWLCAIGVLTLARSAAAGPDLPAGRRLPLCAQHVRDVAASQQVRARCTLCCWHLQPIGCISSIAQRAQLHSALRSCRAGGASARPAAASCSAQACARPGPLQVSHDDVPRWLQLHPPPVLRRARPRAASPAGPLMPAAAAAAAGQAA